MGAHVAGLGSMTAVGPSLVEKVATMFLDTLYLA
jgi:hypothetical protein